MKSALMEKNERFSTRQDYNDSCVKRLATVKQFYKSSRLPKIIVRQDSQRLHMAGSGIDRAS